jgi:SAM-dependent methyltransferase
MRILDCGCGGGGLAVQLARHVASGEVVGFDLNPGAIEQAEQLAASAGCANVRFLVASVFDAPFPVAHFDVAMFCGVLGHIPEPERALHRAYHVLKPGGLLAARDLAKQGDWVGGPRWQTVEAVNVMHAEDIAAAGGDPFIGRGLKALLGLAGFENVEAEASFSPALSSVPVVGALFMRRLQEPDFAARVVARGRYSTDRLHAMIGQIATWMQDETSVLGISECTALARKPQ